MQCRGVNNAFDQFIYRPRTLRNRMSPILVDGTPMLKQVWKVSNRWERGAEAQLGVP